MDQSRMQRTPRYAPHSRTQQMPVTQDAQDFSDHEEEYDDVWPSRMPTSARRYHSDVSVEIGHTRPDVQSYTQDNLSHSRLSQRTGYHNAIPPRRTATQTNMPALSRRPPVETEEPMPHRNGTLPLPRYVAREKQTHWLVYIGVAMIVMLVGWMLLSMLLNWWQVTQDDWHYGRPRTFQTDMVVGHNDSVANPSHFMALNVRRHVEIIEFPGGDSAHAKVYVGPLLIGPGQDLAVVTLNFKDVNGDSKLDMIVNVQGSHFVFINENGAFRPVRANENVQQ